MVGSWQSELQLQLRVGCGAAGRLGVVLLRKTTVAVAFASVWVVLGRFGTAFGRGAWRNVEEGPLWPFIQTVTDCRLQTATHSGSHGALAKSFVAALFLCPHFFGPKCQR